MILTCHCMYKSFITRGSYHMLANDDDLKVGWHPKYKELLQNK